MQTMNRYRHGNKWVSQCLVLLMGLLLWIGGNGCAANPAAPIEDEQSLPAGNPELGRLALQEYGCDSCHAIPGLVGQKSWVGPPLTAWAERAYIAGTLPNEPKYLVDWIRFPQAIEPGTAMPNLGVTEEDAVHMGAYLYTLREDRTWYERFARVLQQ